MAVILGATSPDVFAAIAVLAGCAYRTCADGSGESLTFFEQHRLSGACPLPGA